MVKKHFLYDLCLMTFCILFMLLACTIEELDNFQMNSQDESLISIEQQNKLQYGALKVLFEFEEKGKVALNKLDSSRDWDISNISFSFTSKESSDEMEARMIDLYQKELGDKWVALYEKGTTTLEMKGSSAKSDYNDLRQTCSGTVSHKYVNLYYFSWAIWDVAFTNVLGIPNSGGFSYKRNGILQEEGITFEAADWDWIYDDYFQKNIGEAGNPAPTMRPWCSLAEIYFLPACNNNNSFVSILWNCEQCMYTYPN